MYIAIDTCVTCIAIKLGRMWYLLPIVKVLANRYTIHSPPPVPALGCQ